LDVDISSFSGFVDQAVNLVLIAADRAAELDGRLAFLLGMATWFTVEQAIRRLAGLLRWAILAAVLAGGGAAAVSLFGLLQDQSQPQAPLHSSAARSGQATVGTSGRL
jgi:hypothetical protein